MRFLARLQVNLSQTLSSEQEFTVFAPTSDAFDALAKQLDYDNYDVMIAQVNPDILAQILTYHLVPGENLAQSLSDGQELETSSGGIITISISDGLVQLLDGTELPTTTTAGTVIEADITATNGVVHVIDKVLLSEDIITTLMIDIGL